MNKEKMFETEIAKEFGQELVNKIKKLPDETHLYGQKGTRYPIVIEISILLFLLFTFSLQKSHRKDGQEVYPTWIHPPTF